MRTATAIVMAALMMPVANAGGPLPEERGLSLVGEQELPKVLYVVPWKDPPMGEPISPPAAPAADGFLTPLSRESFRRQLQYQAGVTGQQSSATPATKDR